MNEFIKILYWVLFVVALCFCVAGLMGHKAAWSGAVLSYFVTIMIIVGERKNNYDKK